MIVRSGVFIKSLMNIRTKKAQESMFLSLFLCLLRTKF